VIWHWLNTELWGPIWPNTIAPSAWTLAAVIVSHVKAARQRERHHEDMKQHVTAATGGSDGNDHSEA
jgi:hypothetical protein